MASHLKIFLFLALGTTFPTINAEALPSTDRQAQALLSRADELLSQWKYPEALPIYRKSISLAEKNRDWKTFINAIAGKSYILIRLRKYEHAQASLDSALFIGKENNLPPEVMHNLYYTRGILFQRIQEPAQAIEAHKKALEIRLKILPADHVKLVDCYNGLGEVYRYSLRDYLEAEKNFQAAADILKTNAKIGPKHRYRTFYNMATTNRSLNDFEKALAYGFKSIEALESFPTPDTLTLAKCYGIIANIYVNKRQFDHAIDYYEKAIAYRTLSRRKDYRGLSLDYYNLGVASVVFDDPYQTMACADSMISVVTRYIPYDSVKLADAYFLKGWALRNLGEYRPSVNAYKRTYQIQQSNDKSTFFDVSTTLKHLSKLMLEIEQYDSAVHYAQKAIDIATGPDHASSYRSNPSYATLENKPYLFKALKYKGMGLRKMAIENNDLAPLKLALDCFLLSESLMNLQWQSLDMETSKLQFLELYHHVYELAIDCYYRLYKAPGETNYIEKIYGLMERSKSRVLKERFEDIKAYNSFNIPDSILVEERKLRSEIAYLQGKSDVRSSPAIADSTLQKRNLRLLALDEQLSKWQEDLVLRFPGYDRDRIERSVMPYKTFQNLKKEALFIEYFFGEEALYIFTSTRYKKEVFKVQGDSLLNQINEFLGLIAQGLVPHQLENDFKTYHTLAYRLYRHLLEPALKGRGEDINELYIVPDGILHLLPFHALTITAASQKEPVDYKSLDYVTKKYIVSYAHDAHAHFSTRSGPGKSGLVAFGWSKGKKSNAYLSDLPGATREIKYISSIMPGKFIEDDKVLKSTFVSEAPKYNIIHLAIHGGTDPNESSSTFLQFSDERLFAHELYNIHLDNDLTVLSACETGTGKVFNSEGVYSMARAFSFAGCRSLLMTLWNVGDGSMAPLIRTFYEEMNKQEPLNKAIHRAQVTYLERADPYSAHPVYWAGIELWGNPNSLNLQPAFSFHHVLLIILAFLVLFGAYYYLPYKRRGWVTH